MEYITFLTVYSDNHKNKCNALLNIITFNCEKHNSDWSVTLLSD